VLKKGEGEVTILGKVVAIVRDLEGKRKKG